MLAENKKLAVKSVFLLILLNLCFFALSVYGKIPLEFQEWKKGPLIHKSSAYSSTHAPRLFWISTAALFDLYFFSSFFLLRVAKKSNFLKNKLYCILFIIISSVISFGITEFFLSSYINYSHLATQFRPHPLLYWWNRPNLKRAKYYSDSSDTSTNSMGFRYQEDISLRKPQFDTRIFVLGNSSTFGVGVKDEETFAAQLERSLRMEFKKNIYVLNAACPGHSTFQNLIAFKTMILPFHPDMVIIANNNDACLEHFEDKKRTCHNFLLRQLNIILYKSDYVLLCQRLILDMKMYFMNKLRRINRPALIPRVSLTDYRSIIKEFMGVSQKNNVKLLFVNMPVNYDTLEKFPILRELFYRGEYPEALIQLCQQNNCMLVDVDSDWKVNKEEGLFETVYIYGIKTEAHFHPSRKGHLRMADIIFKTIVQNKLIP